MSKFNLKILLKIVSGIIQVIVRVLSDPDISEDEIIDNVGGA